MQKCDYVQGHTDEGGDASSDYSENNFYVVFLFLWYYF